MKRMETLKNSPGALPETLKMLTENVKQKNGKKRKRNPPTRNGKQKRSQSLFN